MKKPLGRRSYLRSVGAALAVPALSSFSACRADDASGKQPQVRRLACIGTYLGFHQASFFPKQTGANYEATELLRPLERFRDRMSVFSGLDHRGRNGHEGWKAWMTGSATGSVSFDSLIAEHVGPKTRYSSLQLTCGRPPAAARLSYTTDGVPLPMIGRPSVLYGTLFRSDTDKARVRYLIRSNQSVLDGALDEMHAMERKAAVSDRRKLDEYLTSVRDVEKKLEKQQAWLDRPIPKVEYPLPEFDPVSPALSLECETIMYDLMALAFQTDSTRVITFLIPGWSQVFEISGKRLSAGYHGLSHHGNEPAKIAEYNLVGLEHVKRFSAFVKKLETTTDKQGRSLLSSTAVLFGSGMGDSNTHDNSNLPTLLVGGGFRHGSHHAFSRSDKKSQRLGDLYLTLMNSAGVPAEQFAGATQNLNEYLL